MMKPTAHEFVILYLYPELNIQYIRKYVASVNDYVNKTVSKFPNNV